jgi:hypothetical protein
VGAGSVGGAEGEDAALEGLAGSLDVGDGGPVIVDDGPVRDHYTRTGAAHRHRRLGELTEGVEPTRGGDLENGRDGPRLRIHDAPDRDEPRRLVHGGAALERECGARVARNGRGRGYRHLYPEPRRARVYDGEQRRTRLHPPAR